MREDQFRITATLDGSDIGLFATCDGGETDSSDTKYPPGGGEPEESLGGRQTYTNLVLGRNYKRERDHVASKRIRPRVGKGVMVVTKQPLDDDNNPWGEATTYTGKLKRYGEPPAKSDSEDAAILELEMSVTDVH